MNKLHMNNHVITYAIAKADALEEKALQAWEAELPGVAEQLWLEAGMFEYLHEAEVYDARSDDGVANIFTRKIFTLESIV